MYKLNEDSQKSWKYKVQTPYCVRHYDQVKQNIKAMFEKLIKLEPLYVAKQKWK